MPFLRITFQGRRKVKFQVFPQNLGFAFETTLLKYYISKVNKNGGYRTQNSEEYKLSKCLQ